MKCSSAFAIAAGVVMTALTASAQTPKAVAPKFEVVSIKTSTSLQQAVADGSLVGMKVSPGRVTMGHMTLSRLIQTAYGVKKDQIVGPDWLLNVPDITAAMSSTGFDIEATMPPGATADQVPAMLQAMLADRFKLVVRKGSRESDGYALVVAKGGVTFKEKASSGAPGGVTRDESLTASEKKNGEVTIVQSGVKTTLRPGVGTQVEASTIAALADYLAGRLSLPVVDKTGLKGNFDIKMDIPPMDPSSLLAAARAGTPPDLNALSNLVNDSLRTAVGSLGLKLEPQKSSIDAIVVEHVEKTPTAN